MLFQLLGAWLLGPHCAHVTSLLGHICALSIDPDIHFPCVGVSRELLIENQCYHGLQKDLSDIYEVLPLSVA